MNSNQVELKARRRRKISVKIDAGVPTQNGADVTLTMDHKNKEDGYWLIPSKISIAGFLCYMSSFVNHVNKLQQND